MCSWMSRAQMERLLKLESLCSRHCTNRGRSLNSQPWTTCDKISFKRPCLQEKLILLGCHPNAAALHSLRSFHQIQVWLDATHLNPKHYGWTSSLQGLIPHHATKDPAPKSLLGSVSCTCRSADVSEPARSSKPS
ncbi:unnamed protein product [Phaedon cochleariae]|uniref:Uncharacterized protein n=1 Tax=Phaedon cochleariae TaxID=80249 RepID=A0A9N9WZZ5_PHACE|nr:unnamed protein product [Phaedon cochleariae]